MQVYKVFFKILKKQKVQIIMYLAIFMFIAMLVGANGETGEQQSFEAENYSFSILDEDDSEISREMRSYLETYGERVEIEDDEEMIQDALYDRNTNCVLRIPEGFGNSLKDGGEVKKVEYVTIPGTTYAQTFQNLASQYITTIRMYLAGGFSVEEAVKKTEEVCQEKAEVTFTEEGTTTQYGKLYRFFSYVPFIYLCICIVAIGPILIVFHKKNVKDRIRCSMYSQLRTNLELFAGVVTAGLAFLVIYFLLVAAGNGGEALSFEGGLHFLNMLCFAVVALGITFLVGQLVKKTEVLTIVSNAVSLGMSFLCGVFVPLVYLGDSVIKVAHFLPSYWYITAAMEIDTIAQTHNYSALAEAMGIQLLFGIAFVCAGLACSHVKQKGKLAA